MRAPVLLIGALAGGALPVLLAPAPGAPAGPAAVHGPARAPEGRPAVPAAGRRAGAGTAARSGRPAIPGDTVVRARRGDRLVLRSVTGRVAVRGVEGDRVRLLRGSVSDAGTVGLSRSGDRLRLVDLDRKGRSLDRDLVLEVPRWLHVDLQSTELDVRVAGLRADVTLRNVDGDLDVRDVVGAVSLWSVDGEIRVGDVRGSVTAHSVDEPVELARVSGDVDVGSTDGDLRLMDVDGGRVDAQTVDGDIVFEGALHAGGTYGLVTHGGDVSVWVPEGAGARVEVSTFDGSFEATFPVTLERFRGGREMSFTLGDGAAGLVLQAFDGDIRLHRRGGG